MKNRNLIVVIWVDAICLYIDLTIYRSELNQYTLRYGQRFESSFTSIKCYTFFNNYTFYSMKGDWCNIEINRLSVKSHDT